MSDHNQFCMLFGHLTNPDTNYCEECGDYTGTKTVLEFYRDDLEEDQDEEMYQ